MKKIFLAIAILCGILALNACGHTHTFDAQWAVDTESHWHECSCGAKNDLAEHDFGDWVKVKYPTATKTGKKERVCKDCKWKESETLAALGENHTHTPEAPVTCTADEICADCGEVLTVKLGHTEVVDKAVAATCTESGWTEGRHCKTCGEVFVAQEEIPALKHIEVADPAEEATCEDSGKTAGSHCSRCGDPIVAQQIIPALGHAWGTGVTEGTVTTYTCGTCGDTKETYANPYTVVNGGATPGKNSLKTIAQNTLAIYKNATFAQGTISMTMKVGATAGDNGIVFGFKNTSASSILWEGQGITYYFFFVSQFGKAYLGKTTNGMWTVCGEVVLPTYGLNKSYTLSVSRDKSNPSYDQINCYVDGVLYVSYKDSVATDGVQYGIRAGAVGVEYGEFAITSDVDTAGGELDGYYVANGQFANESGKIVSKVANSIAEVKDDTFVYGTLTATVKHNGAADNGLIFSLTTNTSHVYWENDVSYYFFFLNKDGVVLLGKVSYGTWTLCQENVYTGGYDPNGTYRLRVEKDATTIYGYINDVNYITFADTLPLEGAGYGLRAGSAGVAFTEIACESSGEYVETYATDLDVVTGKFTGTNGAVKTGGNDNLALLKDKTVAEGALSATIKSVGKTKVGLAFGYTDDGTTKSYYRLVACKNTQSVNVEKVVGGAVTTLFSNYMSAGFSTAREFNYRVIIENGEAYCYFWNTLYYVVDLELTGTKVGLYAEGAGAQFSKYTVAASVQHDTCDTLLFGHSYFELWGNYKSDLSAIASTYSLGNCLNIGIGGAQASHWKTFKESLPRYNAKKAIYMIGINDLTAGVAPATVVNNIKDTLLYMKDAEPALTVVLLSVNHCPARSTITSQISQTNDLMEALCAQYDWMSYAEIEYAFCDGGTTPSSAWFTDGLHLTAAGYTQKIIPAISAAFQKFQTA